MRYFLAVCILLMTVLVSFTNTFGEVKKVRRYNKITHTWASYPLVSIHDINYISPDSLHLADSLQNSIPARWTSQYNQWYGDTVVIVGVVYAPYHVITYTQHGWTMMLHDTAANSTSFSGVMVRVGGAPDTAQAILDGFLTPERGDVVDMTVVVQDFPTASFNTGPQVAPVFGIDIHVDGGMAPPPAVPVAISDIYQGAYPGGNVNYTKGKQWENTMIKITNLRVVQIVNSSRGTWSMVDSLGNAISDYDESYNFSFTSSETPPTIPDTSVTHFHTPIVGQKIDSIKGFLSVASGQENARGFRIIPVYPGDVAFGAIYPAIGSESRTPVVPTATDSVSVFVKAYAPLGGNPIASVNMYKSINNGPWQLVPMGLFSDSTYQAYIFDQDGNPYASNSFVRYYFAAVDNHGLVQLLANPTFGNSADTSKGFFFYTVTNGVLTIHNIQFTPYTTGVSPYNGATLTVGGIVTADTSDMLITPFMASSGGTNAWYIQSGAGQWNGIWVVSKDTINRAILEGLHHGDSVIVTGKVGENFSVTQIVDSLVTVVSHNNPIPAPVNITTATFGFHGDGDLTAEPYEGVLVRVKNATVTDVNPTFSDPTEYEITDSTGSPMLVRRDGKNSYTNEASDTSLGYTHILQVGDKIDSLTGVGFFSFSRYKITPRSDADYINAGLPLQYSSGWNMVSVYRSQFPDSTGYNVSTLYPGKTSNVFGYNGSGYIIVPNVAIGKGYWIKFGSAKTIRQLGAFVPSDTIPVVAGWNMVGCTGSSVATTSITSFPANNIISKYFGYSGAGYSIKSTLTPPNGYWVKAASAGYIVENEGSVILPKVSPSNSMAGYNSVTITDGKGNSQTLYFAQDAKGSIKLDAYAMPPAGPSGFDARFVSGRMLETYSNIAKAGEQFPINLQSQNGNLTVTWNIVEAGPVSFVLADAKANGISFELKGVGTRKNVKLSSNTLILKIGGSNLIPMSFSLSQNYPNPFNPTTRMQIGVPEASHVTVKVYDILGQLVKTLVNDDRPAGYQTVVWDGSSDVGRTVASGVYFVRMEAEKFVQVQKVVMMK